MPFDARAMKLLQPGEHLTSSEFPGLQLVAFSDCRTWTYRYRSPIDQKIRQIKVGSWPKTSVHTAISEYEKLRARRALGEDPALVVKEKRAVRKADADAKKATGKIKAYTVADVANEYLVEHVQPKRKKKGATEIERMFEKMLGEVGDLPAAELTRKQAFDLIQSHSDRPVVAGYLRSELGAAWNHVIDAGRLPENTPNWWRVILRGKLPSKGKKIGGEHVGIKKRALSAGEVGVLIRWMPNFTQLIQDALTLYLWTCTRGAEILTAEGRDLYKETDGLWWWVIPKEKTKNARFDQATSLRVPLFGRALAVLLRRRERYGEGFLFPARRHDGVIVPVEQKTIQSKVWYHQPYSKTRPEDIRPRLTVTNWAPHDLRRTSRTFLASLDCPVEVAESILGHMLPGVIGDYNVHPYDKQRVEWLRRLSDHLETLAASMPEVS